MIAFEVKGAASVVRISGELICTNSDGLISRLTDWLDHGHPVRVAVDLENMDVLDSSGIGALVSCLTRVRRRNGELVIFGAEGAPLVALKISRADRLMQHSTTEAQALALLARPSATAGG